MSTRVAPVAGSRKDQPVALRSEREDKPVALTSGSSGNLVAPADDDQGDDLVRKLLRVAIDEARKVNPDWMKDSAVAEAIGLKGESGAAYFSKMLSGDKPIGAKHLRALPDDVEAIFARLYAEAFGLIVVAPTVDLDDAKRQLAAGLFGMFDAMAAIARLPHRADRMARADLPQSAVERRRA